MQTGRQPHFGPRERDLALGVALRLLGNRHDAEDAAQDAMLLAYRRRASYRGDAAFTTWLYRVAQTTALMHLRKRRRLDARIASGDLDAVATVPAPQLDPEARTLVAAEVAEADRRLARMGATAGKVARMSLAEGYTSTEIGRALGIKAATAKTHTHRGRAALRAALAGQDSARSSSQST